MDSKKFLDADEVAAEFGLDAATLKQFVDSGEVRALADRGTWKYRRDELQALVEAGKIQLPSMDFPVAMSDENQVLTFADPDDDLSYIELDEDALAEQATMITKSKPEPAEAPEDDWFVPSSEAEMTAEPDDESPAEGSSALAEGSDSDVQIAPDFGAPKPEDSGILLDFNLDAGATVASAGSSLRLPQTTPGDVDDAEVAEADDFDWEDALGSSPAGDSSAVGLAAGESSIAAHDSGIRLSDDSDVSLRDVTGSHLKLPAEESGILLDEGSKVGIGGSVLGGPASGIVPDSGISLESPHEDSGLALEDSHSSVDSGISLSSEDSGISLGVIDSGLSLQAADSGLSLESPADSGLAIDANAKTIADDDLALKFDDDFDRTETLDLATQAEDDSSYEINLDDSDATSELLLGDDDDVDDMSATVVRKGRSSPGSLSGAFELDDAEVEDLEISQDLDADMDVEEVAELSDDDEVFDASDETFSGDEVEAVDDEDYLEPAEAAKKPATPREPSWGIGMVIGLVACTLFLAANTMILWTGVSTMWNGAESEGPGGMLVQTFGDIM